MINIVLIGSGNVATQLGSAFIKAGHNIVGIVSRNAITGAALAKKMQCPYATVLDKQLAATDVILIAVKDDEIKNVVKQLPITKALVVHTSGSIHINVFENSIKNYGVFYPLQTLKNNKQNFKKVPICLEVKNKSNEQLLFNLSKSISDNIYFLDSEQRLHTHLAAVFANNFTNHLYAVAEKILSNNNLPFELLKPLITQTALNANKFSPAKNQTGPAVRNDKVTLDKHLKLLKNDPQLSELYQRITNSIKAFEK